MREFWYFQLQISISQPIFLIQSPRYSVIYYGEKEDCAKRPRPVEKHLGTRGQGIPRDLRNRHCRLDHLGMYQYYAADGNRGKRRGPIVRYGVRGFASL